MIAYVVGGLAVAGVAIAILFSYVRPAGKIWRGDASRTPIQLGPMITVTPRTHPSALLCVGTVAGAFTLGGLAFAVGGITGARWPEHARAAALVRRGHEPAEVSGAPGDAARASPNPEDR